MSDHNDDPSAYALLMKMLLQERITPGEFSQLFLYFFKNDRNTWSGELYRVLQTVFSASDLLAPPEGPDEVLIVTEDELKADVRAALEVINRSEP